MAKRVRKLQWSISLKEEMIDTYGDTLRRHIHNLKKVNKEGDDVDSDSDSSSVNSLLKD